jgi:hypothetical protein
VTLSRLKSNGWNDHTIRKFLGEPNRLAPNPYHKHAADMRLYERDRVVAVEQSGVEWQGTQKKRKSSTEVVRQKRFEKFDKNFADWRKALRDACECLFSLNQYAKHESCTPKHQTTIYDLKNKVIRLLYERGYCCECYHHSFTPPDRECWGCDGTGEHRTGSHCRRCRETGVYRGKTLLFVAFRFLVDNQGFTWHQPLEKVTFPYDVTHPGAAWIPSDEEKPTALSPSKFAEAKDFLRWIVKAASSEAGEKAA